MTDPNLPTVIPVPVTTELPALRKKMKLELMGKMAFAKDTPIAEKLDRTNTLFALAEATQPKDVMEALLTAQMIAAHNMSMDLLRRANLPTQNIERRTSNMKHAAKFMQIYQEQIRALEKYRGRSARQMVVEQLRVESGGQAIVGVMQAPERTRHE